MSLRLTNDDFFTKLTELFGSRQKAGYGSVFLVQKRLTHDNLKQPINSQNKDGELVFMDMDPPKPLPVLIRVSSGDSRKNIKDKIKISTVVQPDDLEKFYIRYGDICKSGMQGLKKRDRSGRKKATKAKKKKDQDVEKKV